VEHDEHATQYRATPTHSATLREPVRRGRRTARGRKTPGRLTASPGQNGSPHFALNRQGFAGSRALPAVAIPSPSQLWRNSWAGVARVFHERLGPREVKRRVLHLSPGFLPFLLWVVPHDPPSSVRFLSVISGLIVTLSAIAYWRFCIVQRNNERCRDMMTAVFGYASVVLVTMLICREHVEVAFAALAVLAFGDGSATLMGLLTRGPKLPWNRRKSIVGTICFVLVATPMAALVYWGQAHDAYQVAGPPRVDFSMALLGTLIAAVAGAIVESLPVRTNDNLRVGTTAALALGLFQWLAVGWV
jgi:dolichol kinase